MAVDLDTIGTMHKAATAGETVREHARKRGSLDGADAQALEHALTITERERDAARAERDAARAKLAALESVQLGRNPASLNETHDFLATFPAGRLWLRQLEVVTGERDAHRDGEMKKHHACVQHRRHMRLCSNRFEGDEPIAAPEGE